MMRSAQMKLGAVAGVAILAMLFMPTWAFAAVNYYSGGFEFHGVPGATSAPQALNFDETIKVTSATTGQRTGPLHAITTTIQGVELLARRAKICTAARIKAAESDASCPKGALLAQGAIEATLGPTDDFTQEGFACDPRLDVWNGGAHKLIFFLAETVSHQCVSGQLVTGQVVPWMATYKRDGGALVTTIPIPNSVNYPLGPKSGDILSISRVNLEWRSLSMNGKYDIQSTGCSGSKRKYSFSFNASLPNAAAETTKTTGAASCG